MNEQKGYIRYFRSKGQRRPAVGLTYNSAQVTVQSRPKEDRQHHLHPGSHMQVLRVDVQKGSQKPIRVEGLLLQKKKRIKICFPQEHSYPITSHLFWRSKYADHLAKIVATTFHRDIRVYVIQQVSKTRFLQFSYKKTMLSSWMHSCISVLQISYPTPEEQIPWSLDQCELLGNVLKGFLKTHQYQNSIWSLSAGWHSRKCISLRVWNENS